MTVVLDIGIVAQVAQEALRAPADPLFLDPVHDLIEVGLVRGLRIVAPAQQQHFNYQAQQPPALGGEFRMYTREACAIADEPAADEPIGEAAEASPPAP